MISYPPLKKDLDLERDQETSADQCLNRFIGKGGSFELGKIKFLPGDAVYCICSGGFCRSQTLWALLTPYQNQLLLFAPHAARYGWDPYNGRINRDRNTELSSFPDEFSQCFGLKKCLPFGFEQAGRWADFSQPASLSELDQITCFYNEHYFGSSGNWKNKKGTRRVFCSFSSNVHVTLHRLNQANSQLDQVIVYAIGLDDLATNPPSFLKTAPRSQEAYFYLASCLKERLDFSLIT